MPEGELSIDSCDDESKVIYTLDTQHICFPLVVDVDEWVQIAISLSGRKITALINGYYFSEIFEKVAVVEEGGVIFGDKEYKLSDTKMIWEDAE